MADYKGLNLRFRGDTTDAAKALNILGNEAKSAQGNLTGIQNALKNTETNGKALNAALKDFQLEQLGKQAEAARGRVDVLGKSMVELQGNLAAAQQKLAENKAALSAMPEKYEKLARVATSSFEQVRAAQDALAEASQRVEFAGTNEAYVQAINDQAAAQMQLNAAVEAGDEAFTKRAAQYGTVEGAINSAEEAERKNKAAIDNTKQSILTATSAAQSYEAQQRSLAASIAASATGLGQFGANAVEFGNNLQSAGNVLSSIGDKMTIVSGIAAMTFGRNIISSTEEFGNAISQLGGYLKIQGSQLDEMSDQALKWGKDTQFSATEAAQAMNELAKGGMTQAQISGGAMQATMELAAAGSLDMAQAAETAVQAIKTFGLDAADASQVADALAGAANESTAEVTDLANGFKYVGGWASMAGWNINDVSGALALLSDHGLQSEMAGTALRNVMQRLAAPTDTAAKLMQQYGFSVRDSSGQMVSATEVVQRLNDTFGKLGDEEKQNVLNDIFGARALPAAIALMDEGADKLQEYIDSTTQVGYAGEMAQNRMGELGWALEMLRGEAETAAVNFGTALTPTIKGAAKAIEDALGWFNGLSDAQKTNVANMALMVTAAGPVLSIVGHLANGVGGLISTIGTGASTIANFVQLMRDGGDSAKVFAESLAIATTPASETAAGMENVAERAAAIEQSLGSLATGAAVAGVVAMLGLLVTSMNDAIEHENQLREATEGLEDAISNMGANFDASYLEEMNSTISISADEIRDSSEDLLNSQHELSQGISDTWSNMGTDSAMLDQYVATMDELSNKSGLTATEQNKLEAAVKGFNSIVGTSISVIDSQNGRLNANMSAIRGVTEAYKEYARAQAVMEEYDKLQRQLVQNQMEQVKYNDALKNGIGEMGLAQALANGYTLEQIDAAQAASIALKDAEKQEQSLKDSIKILDDMLKTNMITAEQYSNELKKLGSAAGNAGKNAASVADLVSDDYGTSVASSIDEAAKEAQKAQKRANDAAYREQQRAYDAEYKALQKALDAAYKDQQKAFDREYKAQQKAFDNEYKALQKQLDKEYSERQKQLDKAYKEYEKQLSSEEDALKKSNDKKLDELKKSNDQQESELKKSLDARYNEYKKQLDAEVTAQKKANDEQLKVLKKSQEQQTKAFGKETDARIKEMERQYKAQLKLLEDNDGTKAIDDRIDALQDQTEAEKLALKEKERNEKEAQLRLAVEQAKTRRSRADAEKALNDYLEKIRVERNEEERKAEIERLKDQKELIKEQTDAKKDALKEQYDAEKEAYKEQRADELELIKEANSAEYDLLKEKLDAQLQSRKDANSALLASMKDENQAQIDAMKELHDTQESNYKEYLTTQLDAMKEAHKSQLEAVKERNTLELESVKEANTATLESLKESQQAQLESLKESQQAELDAMKEGHQEQLDALKQSQQDALQALRDSLDDQLDAVKSGGSRIASASGEAAQLAAFNVKQGVTDGLGMFLGEMSEIGEGGGRSFVDGVGDGGIHASIAAESLASAVVDPISNVVEGMYNSGIHAGINLSNGLNESWDYVADSARGLADGIAMYLGHTIAKRGPLNEGGRGEALWGEHLVQNFIDGMEAKESELARQTRRMAEIVSDEFNPEMGTNYSLGYDVKPMANLLTNSVTEALRSGIPQQRGVTVMVGEMHVREEADIQKVSRKLYQLEEQALRRGW